MQQKGTHATSTSAKKTCTNFLHIPVYTVSISKILIPVFNQLQNSCRFFKVSKNIPRVLSVQSPPMASHNSICSAWAQPSNLWPMYVRTFTFGLQNWNHMWSRPLALQHPLLSLPWWRRSTLCCNKGSWSTDYAEASMRSIYCMRAASTCTSRDA